MVLTKQTISTSKLSLKRFPSFITTTTTMQYARKLIFCLLLALPTALASESLEGIEALDPATVNAGCLATYNREIPECTSSEFSSSTCSSDCISALKSLASDVILACRQSSPDDGSLLKKINEGKLVDTLCPKTREDGDSDEDATITTSITTTTTSPAIERTINETVTSTIDAPATESTAIDPTPQTNTTSSTEARTTDDTILGGDENAAPNAGMRMSVIIAVAIAAVVAVL